MSNVSYFILNILQVLWTKESVGSVSGYSTIPELLEETRVRFIKWPMRTGYVSEIFLAYFAFLQ